MTTTSQLLTQLNAFRVDLGKAPLKAWKESKEKLNAAYVAALTEHEAMVKAKTADPVADFIAENGVTQCPPPKALQDEAKRRERVEAIAEKRITPEALRAAKAKVERKPRTIVSPANGKIDGVTLVQIARELGINDKIARAKMRRVSVPADFLVDGQKHTYHPQHKQWVIDALKRDMRKEPRKA
jgi:hypothetical protein